MLTYAEKKKIALTYYSYWAKGIIRVRVSTPDNAFHHWNDNHLPRKSIGQVNKLARWYHKKHGHSLTQSSRQGLFFLKFLQIALSSFVILKRTFFSETFGSVFESFAGSEANTSKRYISRWPEFLFDIFSNNLGSIFGLMVGVPT